MNYISSKEKEPLILEPEDWTKDEWVTILKIFNLKRADSIMISGYVFEAWGETNTSHYNEHQPITPIRCKDCGRYNLEGLYCRGLVGEDPVCRNPDDFCSSAVIPRKQRRFLINDFCDFNYQNIAFDITDVDKHALERKLSKDHVNHLYELKDANYIAIWNCDLQGFEKENDIFFDIDCDSYQLCKLVNVGEAWFYDILDANRKVDYSKRFYRGEER